MGRPPHSGADWRSTEGGVRQGRLSQLISEDNIGRPLRSGADWRATVRQEPPPQLISEDNVGRPPHSGADWRATVKQEPPPQFISEDNVGRHFHSGTDWRSTEGGIRQEGPPSQLISEDNGTDSRTIQNRSSVSSGKDLEERGGDFEGGVRNSGRFSGRSGEDSSECDDFQGDSNRHVEVQHTPAFAAGATDNDSDGDNKEDNVRANMVHGSVDGQYPRYTDSQRKHLTERFPDHSEGEKIHSLQESDSQLHFNREIRNLQESNLQSHSHQPMFPDERGPTHLPQHDQFSHHGDFINRPPDFGPRDFPDDRYGDDPYHHGNRYDRYSNEQDCVGDWRDERSIGHRRRPYLLGK